MAELPHEERAARRRRQLEIDLTIDDAKAYTKPWTVTLVQRIVLDTELMDYHCNDNEKDAQRLVGK